METKIELAYLYDFYGEMLNEHQQRIFEDFVLNDLSLGEIAAEEGTSRQAVRDLISRTCTELREYEEKLGLAKKFADAQEHAKRALELCEGSEVSDEVRREIQLLVESVG